MECGFIHNSTGVSACGIVRIGYDYGGRGFRRSFYVRADEPCGE